jgi:hypothetical protein
MRKWRKIGEERRKQGEEERKGGETFVAHFVSLRKVGDAVDHAAVMLTHSLRYACCAGRVGDVREL